MALQWLGILAAVIVANVVLWIITRGLYERLFGSKRSRQTERRCQCGYILKALSVPRCPECGRAVGFDKTFEELGLSPDEIRRLKESRH
jgi:hypothetical protein